MKMKKWRLTSNSICGFELKDFNTIDELINYANEQSKLELITPIHVMLYDEENNNYKIYFKFIKE